MSKRTIISLDDTDNNTEEIKTVITEENMDKIIMDMSLSIDDRLEALSLYFDRRGSDNTVELINKIVMMYEFSGTKIIREYLYRICEKNITNSFLQAIAASALYGHDDKDEYGYDSLMMVYPRLENGIGATYRLNLLKMLMRCEKYQNKTYEYFSAIINDGKLDAKFRYKSIVGLDIEYYVTHGLYEFASNKNNEVFYRILACQNLLQNYSKKCTDEQINSLYNILLEISNNTENDYNIRADAADALLKLGNNESKNEAQNVIMNLARVGGPVKSIYENAQNVHNEEVENSVKECLEFLHTFEILRIRKEDDKEDTQIDFPYVRTSILKLCDNDEEKLDRVNIALNRIELDRVLYSSFNCTLSHVLLRIWTYIVKHKDEAEMKIRLIQELCEMAGTCSSGFVSRLINVISGFGDFSIRISWRDQIIANLTGRLNARIRDMDDLKMQAKIMEEMTLETDDYGNRENFLYFLKENMLSIREEMHLEFMEHISDVDFDLYFRNAVSMYETGKFM